MDTAPIELKGEIELGKFVLMLNHIHGIVVITESNIGMIDRSLL